MPDTAAFLIFLAAAIAIAVVPGPGILYVAGRTLAGGRAEGIASTLGTALGGVVQVLAGAFGVAALLLASAAAFTVLKLCGALYLVWLGIVTWRAAAAPITEDAATTTGARRAFRQGVLVEMTNPKTAAFLLAFLPQFIVPDAGGVMRQFILRGVISVGLNSLVDALVVFAAAAIRARILRSPLVSRRMRQGSAAMMLGLGVTLALSERPG